MVPETTLEGKEKYYYSTSEGHRGKTLIEIAEWWSWKFTGAMDGDSGFLFLSWSFLTLGISLYLLKHIHLFVLCGSGIQGQG